MLRKCLCLLSALLATASFAHYLLAPGMACGVERWSVKTGTDADAGLVNINSTSPTTIATLRSLTAPNPIPSNNRVQPTETTVWVINATLTEYKLESDEDYHLVISDSNGQTMICEIPAPHCVGSGSPFLNGVTNSRSEFDAKFNVTTSFQTANIPVTITGVGMFDFLHGQTGVAPNGIELHPVLDVQFAGSSDFSVSDSPSSLSIQQGSSGSSTVSTTLSGSFNSAISLSASGLPSGVSAAFNPSTIAAPGSGSSTLSLTASSSAAVGTATVTITAAGGGKTHTTTLGLTVTSAPTPNFAISASPTSVSVTQGGAGSSTISTTVSGGFNSALSLSASGLPSGVGASFSPTSISAPGSGSSTLTLTATSSATTGTSTVTITATGGGVTHSVNIALTVSAVANPDFSISAAPASISIAQGGSGSSTISTTISGGFNSAVSLSASGLPSGVTAAFNPTSIAAPGSGSATLTLSASSTAAVGAATVTVTGTGGGKTHTASISLTVNASGGTQQLLGNPGFENGSANPSPWSATSGVINNNSGEPPHTGSWDAWLDGYGTTHTDTLQQTVAIPSTISTATLSFWLHIDTAETSTTRAFDTLTVQVRNSSGQTVLATLATFSNLDHNTGYRQVSFDLSSFKGQTITIYLLGQEDFELQTSFVVDDFTLNVQ